MKLLCYFLFLSLILVLSCHKEDNSGDASNDDQADVDGAVQTLARAAVNAFCEMMFVISAHLRSNSGYVITPAGEYVADYLINAM